MKVTPIWDGGGTVKLTILDSDFNKASDTLITLVQEEICPQKSSLGLGLAPIGHCVTVDTVEESIIDLTTNITTIENANIDIVKQQIIQQINDYLLELRKTWGDNDNLIIRLSQIEARILNIDGVLDIANTKINSNTGNIELQSMQIPVLGEVNIS